jgi:hypothetical protein
MAFFMVNDVKNSNLTKYRVIQEELPPLTELISEDILRQKVSYKPGVLYSIFSELRS